MSKPKLPPSLRHELPIKDIQHLAKTKIKATRIHSSELPLLFHQDEIIAGHHDQATGKSSPKILCRSLEVANSRPHPGSVVQAMLPRRGLTVPCGLRNERGKQLVRNKRRPSLWQTIRTFGSKSSNGRRAADANANLQEGRHRGISIEPSDLRYHLLLVFDWVP